MLSSILFTFFAFSSVASAYHKRAAWYHERDHPVAQLFKRDTTYPAVGSPQWTAAYPSSDANVFTPAPKNLPDAWVQALNKAVAAGLIPNVSVSTVPSGASPVYPGNEPPTDKNICSASYECRGDGDVWDAPAGMVGLAFDDGPLPPSPNLYKFLKQNNQHATHFFIGGNILNNPQIFLQAYQDNNDDIAVHTWTHPYMTSQTNMQVLAELGYTMQIIHDSTGGRVPKYWRPPFGDVDNRVRAIAKQVFGLTTVIWNQDSADWELTYGAIPIATVEASLKSFYSMPKNPGLLILEHELSDNSVNAFMYGYTLLKQNGWKAVTIPDAAAGVGGAWYQNALNNTAAVSPMDIAGSAVPSAAPSSSAASSTASSTGSSSSSSTTSTTSRASSTSPSSTQTPSSGQSNSSLRQTATVAGIMLSFVGTTMFFFA